MQKQNIEIIFENTFERIFENLLKNRPFVIAFLIISLLNVPFAPFAHAQEDKFKKDTTTIKGNPKKDNKDKNSKNNPKNDKKNPSEAFDPKKELSIISEDTTTANEDFTSLIQVSEFLKIDCVFVKAAEYYSVWNSKFINPYNIKSAKLRDTIAIQVFNPKKNQLWASPLDEILVTSPFAWRWGRMHAGIDFNLKTGWPVYSLFDGIVRISTAGSGYGYHVMVRHYNGLESLYGHFSALKCKVGDVVKAGQLIGLGGSTGYSTGPHLHLEVHYAGNAFNPAEFLDFKDPKNLVKSEMFYITSRLFRHYGSNFAKKYEHIVRPDDTLEKIAKRYGVTVSFLININRLKEGKDDKDKKEGTTSTTGATGTENKENIELKIGTKLKIK